MTLKTCGCFLKKKKNHENILSFDFVNNNNNKNKRIDVKAKRKDANIKESHFFVVVVRI